MSANGLQIVFGAAGFISSHIDHVKQWLQVVEQHGIKTIDTAHGYGASEELLGQAGAASKFTIDSKHPGGFGAHPSTRESILQLGKQSLERLQTDALDVYYLHAPDGRVSWKDTLSGLDELHKKGAFKRLGLSNFTAQDVEQVIRTAEENGFVVPSVYQGNYSAVARRTEDEILPTLRKHNMAFYAYSPIAGGFLSKSRAELAAQGRFSDDDPLAKIYNAMYNRPGLVAALDVWGQIALDEGVSRAELAYRWIVYHSMLRGDLGDAVVVGARKETQLRDTMQAMKRGPLSPGAVERIDEFWEGVKAEAWLDNYEMLSGK